MDTEIVVTIDGKQFNKYGQQVIDCSRRCGNKTTMLLTKLCDACWNELREATSSTSGPDAKNTLSIEDVRNAVETLRRWYDNPSMPVVLHFAPFDEPMLQKLEIPYKKDISPIFGEILVVKSSPKGFMFET